jgi:hypothetical protein
MNEGEKFLAVDSHFLPQSIFFFSQQIFLFIFAANEQEGT